MPAYKHLLLRNRMVKPAQWLFYAGANGSEGETAIAFYETIARGGVGLEAAEFLVKRGRKVTIVETGPQPGAGMPLVWLVRLMPWLAAKGVAVHAGIRAQRPPRHPFRLPKA